MNVEQLPNYGKDLLSIRWEAHFPLKKRLLLAGPWLLFAVDLLKALGWRGTAGLVCEVWAERRRARRMDWSHLRERRISDRDLQRIINQMAMAKALANRLGLRKAAYLRRRLSEKIAYPVFEEFFAPLETFIRLGEGDWFGPFKQYYRARMDAMRRAGLEEARVVEDSATAFQVNVVYCAWAEVAKTLGNGRYCYYSVCQGDEVFFPKFCERAGFQFERFGTLGQEEPCCDHRFFRKGEV